MPWKNQFNVFERIESVKRILQPLVPDGNSVKVRGLVMRCSKYRAKLIDKLTPMEAKAYDILLSRKLNPKTVYLWLLLEDAPPELRQKLEQNTISILDARSEFVKWKRMASYSSSNELMRDIREVVGKLRWKSQENTPAHY